MSFDSYNDDKLIDFGTIPVDSIAEKYVRVENNSFKTLTYRVSLLYVVNDLDQVFKLSVTSTPVKPGEFAEVKIVFKPNNPKLSYTDYYLVDDTGENSFRLTVTGKCFGPNVILDKKKITFSICKSVAEGRIEEINMINHSEIDTTYQWLLPPNRHSYFQISIGVCGLIRAYETISATVTFSGTANGTYCTELVCLILNQEPLFLNLLSTVVLPGITTFKVQEHMFERNIHHKGSFDHLMENSLSRLTYIPSASVFDTYLDFETGSVSDITMNISQTLCVTNHEDSEGVIQWISDPDNIFIIEPVNLVIPPNESRLFTIRFRPKYENKIFSFLLCGDYKLKYGNDEESKIKHIWYRIPCIGNTWSACTEWPAEWWCPTEVVLPPTVPTRTTFTNFMLSNKLDVSMYFKFVPPKRTNFTVMPMCGLVTNRAWQIITLALEPKTQGDYCETWDLIINKTRKVRICFSGNAEESTIEFISHGYNPATHAMYEFRPTITGCTNYCTAYLHNLTRMEIHLRTLNTVSWLGADNCGTIVLPPKEIVRYHWWFFPKEPDKVYDTTVTCSCVCLIDGRPVGEPTEIFIHITGYSEFPDLRVLPNSKNLHDIVVSESVLTTITLYNNGSCYYTSKLYFEIDGLEDDFSSDIFEIESTVNSLKPSTHCDVVFTVTPYGAGPRQINIKYTVLFRNEYNDVEEIQPITKTICIIWYDGIYPTLKVKRTISVKCPVILSNHCVWNIANVEELNKAFSDCRPNKPLHVDLYAPDLCVRLGTVQLIFVLGCVYRTPVAWNLRREKICDCEMVEVKIGISTYEMRHNCVHRSLAELTPLSGIVSPENPNLLYLNFTYKLEGRNVLRYLMTLPNQRSIVMDIHIFAHQNSKGILTPLRRPVRITDYLAVLDCGKVPINNLDPVIRMVWLYNPTDVFTTWRLLRGNTVSPSSVIRCLLYFAEVPPLGKLAIPFTFKPTEMIDYEVTFSCSFGYDNVKILVRGQGGLPNCFETRLDIPRFKERVIRFANRNDVVYLSTEHVTLREMPTHSLSRDIICICNDTDHVMRFIWLPERIANIVNIVMTPCWGVLQPKKSEWVTMTVYTLQEPATFTTTVACEILNLSERRRYQRNEMLRRSKIEKCNQEFIITEEGFSHPGINDSPPYVLEIEKPQPFYIATTVSISSKGQRDGYPRMLLKQMWEQPPQYDLLSTDINERGDGVRNSGGNSLTMADIIMVIDGILWDALHSKMFKNQIKHYSKEEIPTYEQLLAVDNDKKPKLSRRVTSGICDAIVNKAVFHVYGLTPKHEANILEAE